MIALLTGCGSSDSKKQAPAAADIPESSTTASSNDGESTGREEGASGPVAQDAANPAPAAPDNGGNQSVAGEQLLQSASIDLNGDGISEQVEALQVQAGDGNGETGEIEGLLRIRSGEKETGMTFWRKSAGMSGILTSIQFEDLDGDGARDVFILIPDNGASFSYSNYFIYSYQKNISYSFTRDYEMADFINGFGFEHATGNKLRLVNNHFGFSAEFSIEFEEGRQPSEEDMAEYEKRSWIEPVPVDIGEEARMALVSGTDGPKEIKVPLPVFGFGTVDMIGELDLYYAVDSSFHPVLKRFEVLDFKGNERVKIGSCDVKQE